MMASFDKALDVARERMGFAELFPKQREAVEAFVSGRDVFISLPTGYGKSFCYGCLPIVFNCLRNKTSSIVVVVTPLVAIMKEQAIDFERKAYQPCTLLVVRLEERGRCKTFSMGCTTSSSSVQSSY